MGRTWTRIKDVVSKQCTLIFGPILDLWMAFGEGVWTWLGGIDDGDGDSAREPSLAASDPATTPAPEPSAALTAAVAAAMGTSIGPDLAACVDPNPLSSTPRLEFFAPLTTYDSPPLHSASDDELYRL